MLNPHTASMREVTNRIITRAEAIRADGDQSGATRRMAELIAHLGVAVYRIEADSVVHATERADEAPEISERDLTLWAVIAELESRAADAGRPDAARSLLDAAAWVQMNWNVERRLPEVPR